MKLQTVLRILILSEILLAIAAGVVDLVFPELLPVTYREIAATESTRDFTVADWLGLALAPFAIASVFGLWLLKNWGRWLYTTTSAGYSILELFVLPQAISSPASVLNDLSFACLGGTLILIWFSDLKNHFVSNLTGHARKSA